MSHDATKNLNDVMRKYDRESNTRAWEGKPKIAVQAYLAAFAIFEVYVTLFGTMLDEVRLTSFVGGLLIAGYLIYPSHKHEFRVNFVPWYDWVIMALGAASFFYFCFNANTIVQQLPALKTYEVVLGVIGIVALFELCRRSTGVPIMVVAGVFIVYALYYYGVKRASARSSIKRRAFSPRRSTSAPSTSRCSSSSARFWSAPVSPDSLSGSPTPSPARPRAARQRSPLFRAPCAAWCPARRSATRSRPAASRSR